MNEDLSGIDDGRLGLAICILERVSGSVPVAGSELCWTVSFRVQASECAHFRARLTCSYHSGT